MPVSEEIADRLSAAIVALTAPEREGTTWSSLPGEAPKQTDLLLGFVENTPNAAVTDTLAGEIPDDALEAESPVPGRDGNSVAQFEKRTQRLIDAIRAEAGDDFRRTPVRLAVIRRVDPANRKVVYAGSPTVGEVFAAASEWATGEKNVPRWITLPVLRKGERKPRPMSSPHVAPLGIIAFSKQFFIRGGTERQEITGLAASEALGLFLDLADRSGGVAGRRVQRILRLVLRRRSVLVAATTHALRRGFDGAKAFDRREVVRTITVLGLLLHKLGRHTEDYMAGAAFKLGQLLAAVDVVHAGYCADMRGGDVPPSLLGNQVFTMALSAPVKALAVLSRRWKPYDGWARKAAREWNSTAALVGSTDKDQRQRGWDVRRAVRHAREMRRLADELRPLLNERAVDDTFRAELLLGYVAGLPATRKEETGDDEAMESTAQEA